MKTALVRYASHRFAPLFVVLIGVALCLPSLRTGFVGDDYVQLFFARHPHGLNDATPHSRGPYDLFAFLDGTSEGNHALKNAGAIPWTTGENVKIRFFRPLSSVTHAIDFALWPRKPWAMHLVSILYYAFALGAAWLFYRRFLDQRATAVLALLLYAIDDAHGGAVEWIANRNTWVALAFGLPAIVFHDRFRRDGWKPGAWLGPLAFLLGILGGESAYAVAGYLVAYAIHLDSGPLLRRAARISPYLAVAIACRGAALALGFGTAHTFLYLDPSREPLGFLVELPGRLSANLAAQFAFPFAEATAFADDAGGVIRIAVRALVVAILLAIAYLVVRSVRSNPTLRFLATGAVLSTLPACATLPADRLLAYVGIGAMGLIAHWIMTIRGWRWAFVAIHLAVAPALLVVRSRSWAPLESALARSNASIPAGKTAVLLNPPADFLVRYVMITRAAVGAPRPAQLRWLASSEWAIEVLRVDAHTLRIRPERGFVGDVTSKMLRDPSRDPFHPGDVVILDGLRIEVVSITADGRPAEVVFRFDMSLDDERVWLGRWERGGFVPWHAPRIGEVAVLSGESAFETVFGR